MASSWISPRTVKSGKRYRVLYRLGGRESKPRYGGSFKTRREALARKKWIDGQLAGLHMPDVRSLARTERAPLFETVAEGWRESRVDAGTSTAHGHKSGVKALNERFGRKRVDEITTDDITAMVAEMVANTSKRATVEKRMGILAMILDYAGVEPNPARDRKLVKLPHHDEEEICPPIAEHVEAVFQLLAWKFRVPVLCYDATGARLNELLQMTIGEMDEPRCRFLLRRSRSKTSAARWIDVPPDLFQAVLDTLPPREDRSLDQRVFSNVRDNGLRAAISRSCKFAGIPEWSPQDLRHRRISLWHHQGVPWAEIGRRVGQKSLAITADTYTHVLLDDDYRELDYESMLRWSRDHVWHRAMLTTESADD